MMPASGATVRAARYAVTPSRVWRFLCFRTFRYDRLSISRQLPAHWAKLGSNKQKRGNQMKRLLITTGLISGCLVTGVTAQVELKTYADKDGYLNVQALTCAQLVGTFQEDADLLTT
jgi:hypothetical protein